MTRSRGHARLWGAVTARKPNIARKPPRPLRAPAAGEALPRGGTQRERAGAAVRLRARLWRGDGAALFEANRIMRSLGRL